MISILTLVRETMRGKTIGRMLLNDVIMREARAVHGKVLDLAGSSDASYVKFFSGVSFEHGNIHTDGSTQKIDFNEQLPCAGDTLDAVLLFNALYIAEDPLCTLREVARVLKPGGTLLLSTPWIGAEIPEPHDYQRWTKEGLERLLADARFKSIRVFRVGERFSACAYLLHPLLYFSVLRVPVHVLAVMLDACIPTSLRVRYPVPILYFVSAHK